MEGQSVSALSWHQEISYDSKSVVGRIAAPLEARSARLASLNRQQFLAHRRAARRRFIGEWLWLTSLGLGPNAADRRLGREDTCEQKVICRILL